MIGWIEMGKGPRGYDGPFGNGRTVLGEIE